MSTLPTPPSATPHRGRLRRLRATVGLVLVCLSFVSGLLGSVTPAGAQSPSPSVPSATPLKGVVSVVTVNGYIDPVLEQFMTEAIDDANAAKATALIFQVDLQGSVIPDERLNALIVKMKTSATPVYLWIGPSGSELAGNAGLLTAGAAGVAMAPGTSITVWRGEMYLVMDAKQAEDAKIATFAPTLGDYFVSLPGVQTEQVTENGQTKLKPVTEVVFNQLPLGKSFFHSFASPAVAYLLLSIGLCLLIFELFTAGVGVAGVLGAGSFVFACYGLAVLPLHWYGLAAIVLAMLAFAIDVQTGVPRFWTGAGMVLYVIGSFTLYDGVTMSWLTIAIGIIGVSLTFFAGMPSMVRTRFSTPTIGREWMIGEMGRAVTDVNPDGVVQIKGAQWRAFTNRATPIEQLDKVRVVGIEGLVLEVEPEEGGAKDYRERSPKGEKQPEDAV